MKKILISLLSFLVMFPSLAKVKIQIVPQPASIIEAEGSFRLDNASFGISRDVDEASAKMIAGFADYLGGISAIDFKVSTRGSIYFDVDTAIPSEGYRIACSEKKVSICAKDYNGFFYAVQTLKQMLPTSIYGKTSSPRDDWSLPCCQITDSPRFAYRGMLLDCCRHFWSTKQVKKCIDIMAAYKLNRLHWHLTDDQGWRVEVKRYPKLTEIGAWRDGTMIGRDYKSNDGIRHGGFYTQEEIKEIVKYAAERGITIIPEVDLPGHMQAALAAYPGLGCEGSQPQPYQVRTTWGISKQVLCVGKESTMEFLENVVSEVADLFPGEYFHIGGDECPRTEWESDPDCQAKIKELGLFSYENCSKEARLQNYVTARIQKVLDKKGKKVIGWDEVLEGNLSKGVVVMSWRGTKGGIKASSMGHDVIMTPNIYCYIDHCQSENVESEPLCITRPDNRHRAVTIEKMYGWDPYDGIDAKYQHHILGPQANLWTEYIGTPEYLEYMMLPRLLAMSEIQWCTKNNKDFTRFNKSLREHQFKVLATAGYNFRNK